VRPCRGHIGESPDARPCTPRRGLRDLPLDLRLFAFMLIV
jgi:hypothetical protein